MRQQVEKWLKPITKMILPYWTGENTEVITKDDGSPVTYYDRTIEHYLRDCIMQALPDDGIIGEEFSAHQPQAKRQWVIDPIDGTRNFIAKIPLFTTLIALLDDGKPIFSAIYQPITGELWCAQEGRLYFNSKRHTPSAHAAASLEEATFATTSPTLFRQADKPKIETIYNAAKAVIWGGDGYAYAKLASGEIDLIIESAMQPYDFLPLIPIIEASGALITDWQGKPLGLESKGDVIAIRNKPLHREIVQRL